INLPAAIPGEIAKACVEGRVIPPEEQGRRPGEGKGKGTKDAAKGKWKPKAETGGGGLPPPPPNARGKIEELLEERSAAHAASQVSGAASSSSAGAAGADVLAEREGPKASVAKEEAAAEKPAAEKPAAEAEEKKAKSDTEEVLKEVFLSLRSMRRRAVARNESTTREVLELLFAEQQKLNERLESLLSRQQEPERAVADRVEQAWAALRSKDASSASDFFRELDDATVQSMRDVAGMNPLHLVARERWYGMSYTLIGRCPSLCNEVSLQRQPPNWTPLMSLANQPKATGAEAKREYEILVVMLPAMTTDALMTQSGTGATCTHLAVSKGNLELVRQVLWELWSRDRALPRRHLELANSMGKSAVDVAFRNNADFARYLQDNWQGPVYTERPAWDERGYAYAWRGKGKGR
ncbi:DNAJB13, partial [Symbiodinium sp. KB8]